MPQFDFYVASTLIFYISIAFPFAFAILMYFVSSRIQQTLELRKSLLNLKNPNSSKN